MKLKTTVYNEPAPDPRLARRQRKADALRRHALSPLRILLMVLALPLTTGMIALGVYLRTSDLERTEAVMHLVALAGCDAARSVGLGPMREGQLGYHKRNDPDGDGIACESSVRAATRSAVPVQAPASTQSAAPKPRAVGNAKFVRP
ncbi:MULTISPECIES: excalibur calcium-binding domain-containing protein [Ruegeria]|uniref:excalibur calcium-binding domain-containing protein n=1 Tax=Ruegeria TaxID=97050 RepID=UPI00147A5965|nr:MULTISPECIES: excalibur calcium-binding domain-containing protein [Ruegeria]UWR07608.1 excalibur calcium-binding domain-containing protein [Ruegeria sp. B32]